MPKVQVSEPKLLGALTQQWDHLAAERDRQISTGSDISFNHVVAPTALSLLEGADLSILLDIGSGTGHFAALAAKRASTVVGIEPSEVSVDIATRVCAEEQNIRFIRASIEDVALTREIGEGTAAVALMVLMAAPNLSTFAQSLRSLLANGAVFVSVIPHPCFWPRYWGVRGCRMVRLFQGNLH